MNTSLDSEVLSFDNSLCQPEFLTLSSPYFCTLIMELRKQASNEQIVKVPPWVIYLLALIIPNCIICTSNRIQTQNKNLVFHQWAQAFIITYNTTKGKSGTQILMIKESIKNLEELSLNRLILFMKRIAVFCGSKHGSDEAYSKAARQHRRNASRKQ